MPKNTQPDVEGGMVTPQKAKKGAGEVSPAKTAPLTPPPVEVNVQHRNIKKVGLCGMSRMKTFGVCGILMGLAGGAAYFCYRWFEIPGIQSQIDRLEGEVDRLQVENNRFTALNDELNSTVTELNIVKDDLNGTAIRLDETNQELGIRIIDLQQQNEDFAEQNAILNETAKDLILVAGWLDGTSQTLSDTVEEINARLAEQIKKSQRLKVSTLENQYKFRKDSWNCDYASIFGGNTYTNDYSVEIPSDEIDRIMEFLSTRVLDELCLDVSDFKVFLELPQYIPLTSNKLNTAMGLYTERALSYYFPDQTDSGLTQEDWSAANLDCQNLPTDKWYKFSS